MTGLVGVALAAGAGTRLRPLTTLRPKALCPVGNVPLLDRALAHLRPYTDDIAVNAHHMAEQIVAHLRGRVHLSVEEPDALGTAGALGRLRGWIDGRGVLLVNADTYLTGGLEGLVTGWDGRHCRLLAAPVGGPGDFTDRGRPLRYVGACVLPWGLVSSLTPEPSGLYEILWRREAAAGRLRFAVHTATAIDCGTPGDYLDANLQVSGGRSVVDAGASVDGAIEGSVVGAGASVDGTIERCVVWPDAYVAPHERLIECIRAGSRTAPLTVRVDRRPSARPAPPASGQ